MNQVIRIIFDDDIDEDIVTSLADNLKEIYGNMAAISLSEREYEDGQEQRQGTE